jgi:hypothetical protein
MPATITDKYKRLMLDGMWNSFYNLGIDSGQDSDRYYIGIGRTETWSDDDNPPTPAPDQQTITTFQTGMQGVKLVTDLSYVIPRYNWSAGSVYTAWSNSVHSETTVGALNDIAGPYYVITEDQNVYLCIQQGMTDEGVVRNSIYKPDQVVVEPFEAGPDGYVWKFMYNVGVYNARRYLTSEWVPVEYIADSSQGGPASGSLSASRLAQVINQYAATPGQLLSISVDSGGSGYTSAPTVNIYGFDVDSASSAKAYAKISEGKVVQIIMKDSAGASGYSFGSGYDHRTYITLSGGGGSGASLSPNMHLDSGGLAFDPRNDLNASALMYTARIIGSEEEVFNINNDFRQVGLLRNPLKDSTNDSEYAGTLGDSDFVAIRGSSLRKIYVGAGIDAEKTTLDNIVTGVTSGAKAYLNYYKTYIDSDCCDSSQNTSHNVLYVHQSPTTGYGKFTKGEAVELSDGAGTATIIAHADSDMPALRWGNVDPFSGDVLYVDNRVPIDRDEDQTEDIKIVVDL